MILMENGRMDSDSKIAATDSNHFITELSISGKSIKPPRFNDDLAASSSVTSFQNVVVDKACAAKSMPTIESNFVNCNGNAAGADSCLESSGVLNGDEFSCGKRAAVARDPSTTKKTNSSQCNSSSKSNCGLENELSALSIDKTEASSSDKRCSNGSTGAEDGPQQQPDQGPSIANTKQPDNEQCNKDEGDSTRVTDDAAVQQDNNRDSHSDNEKEDNNSSEIMYISYESENQMPDIMKLIQKDLSEPYSIYTYRYFIHNWPHLCFLAVCKGTSVGAIVCKLDLHRKVIKRGYIAMLAVDECYRKQGIGSNLVLKAIRVMAAEGADEVVLETEITNQPALRLYENLGFVRDKRLFRYYLNGVDALRLKLWLR